MSRLPPEDRAEAEFLARIRLVDESARRGDVFGGARSDLEAVRVRARSDRRAFRAGPTRLRGVVWGMGFVFLGGAAYAFGMEYQERRIREEVEAEPTSPVLPLPPPGRKPAKGGRGRWAPPPAEVPVEVEAPPEVSSKDEPREALSLDALPTEAPSERLESVKERASRAGGESWEEVNAALRAGDATRVEAELEKLERKTGPDRDGARLARAQLLVRAGERAKARVVLAQLLADGSDPVALARARRLDEQLSRGE